MLTVELQKQRARIFNLEQPAELPSPKFAMSLASPPNLEGNDSHEWQEFVSSGIIGSCYFEEFDESGELMSDDTSSHMETVLGCSGGEHRHVRLDANASFSLFSSFFNSFSIF